MERELTNRNCPLWGSETCARLNMRACRGCPAEEKDALEADQIRADVDQLYALLPPEGVASLFTGERCTLCRGERKGKRTCYGLYDMGHADPRAQKKKLSLFRGKAGGFLIPLQFGCCDGCRRRYQLLGWLPSLTVILCLGLALAIVAQEPVAQSLRAVWRGLPLLTLLLVAAISFAAGKVLVKVLRDRFNQLTYMDLKDHPMVRRMSALGWEGLQEGKYPQPVFTRQPLTNGVGTLVPEESFEGDGKISD